MGCVGWGWLNPLQLCRGSPTEKGIIIRVLFLPELISLIWGGVLSGDISSRGCMPVTCSPRGPTTASVQGPWPPSSIEQVPGCVPWFLLTVGSDCPDFVWAKIDDGIYRKNYAPPTPEGGRDGCDYSLLFLRMKILE